MADFFAGKVVIITGSSSGIGRDTAVLFAKRGAKVVLTGRNTGKLQESKRLCVEAGAREEEVFLVAGDVVDEATAARIINETVETFECIDVLVNNAGARFADPLNRMGIEQPVELFDQSIAVNTRSVLVLSQLAIPHLVRTRGAIVNVSSMLGAPFTFAVSPYYCIAKAALDALTVQMAGSLILKGIRVNGVSPGVVRTNFATNYGVAEGGVDKFYDAFDSRIPLGRVGKSTEIAELIAFLADRSKSEFIVGQRYVADGGAILMLGTCQSASNAIASLGADK